MKRVDITIREVEQYEGSIREVEQYEGDNRKRKKWNLSVEQSEERRYNHKRKKWNLSVEQYEESRYNHKRKKWNLSVEHYEESNIYITIRERTEISLWNSMKGVGITMVRERNEKSLWEQYEESSYNHKRKKWNLSVEQYEESRYNHYEIFLWFLLFNDIANTSKTSLNFTIKQL